MSRTVTRFGTLWIVFSDDTNGRRLSIAHDKNLSRPGSYGKHVEVVGQIATNKREVRALISTLKDLADELPD